MAGQNRLRPRRVPLHFARLDQPAWKLSGSVPGAGRRSQRRIALPGEVGLLRIRHDAAVIGRHQAGQKRMLELPRSERSRRTLLRAVLSRIAEGCERERNHQANRAHGNKVDESTSTDQSSGNLLSRLLESPRYAKLVIDSRIERF